MRKIFLGPPGSGKGTVSSKLAPLLKIPHISTGDLLRENLKNETPIGLKAKEFMESGKLVPDEIVIDMLKDRIKKKDCKKGFILDGFPRTILQAQMLDAFTNIDVAVNMNVTDDVVIARNSARVTCKDCGEIFNLRHVPPKKEGTCDKCGGDVIRRKDDEPETILKRLNEYKKQSQPLVDYYKNSGILREVICTNPDQSPKETFESVLDAISDIVGDLDIDKVKF
jgi:adenylate kinase